MKPVKKIVLAVVAVEVASQVFRGESFIGNLFDKQAKPSVGASSVAIDVIEGPQSAATLAAVGAGPTV